MRNSYNAVNLTLSKRGWHKKRGVGYPMKKRFLALTIAVLMALCVIPFAASADDAEVTIRVGGWPEEATDPVSYAAYAGYLEKMNELYPKSPSFRTAIRSICRPICRWLRADSCRRSTAYTSPSARS